MATNFPENLDTFINPDSNNPLSNPSHSDQHKNANDAITALQEKVGTNNSTDANSLDYRVAQLEVESGSAIVETLGLSGNNDQTITGIENPTVIDTFDSSVWSSLEYRIQVSKDSKISASTISIVVVNGIVNASEYDVVSNTDESLYDLTFTANGSNINLLVTPIQSPITVRFYRVALKK